MDITVKGKLTEKTIDDTLYYLAAAPANYMANYTGSGLPFANRAQAFDNTPNRGKTNINYCNGFNIKLYLPNSYMCDLTNKKIPPTLYLQYKNLNNEIKTLSIKISEGIPYRDLSYPIKRTSNSFYLSQFENEVKDQWKILIDSSYPTQNIEMPINHWGLKPPL